MGGDFGEKVGLGRDGPELDPPKSTNPATGLHVHYALCVFDIFVSKFLM